ncbi:small-conductance mechanosensitive channel [Pararhizobium capsulatum DSM 1112]|uniref:Small-conductance mechanosensitive channel n=1 Tax=Pararhizobium capsulatum DSM 1112 TaxID=1121113 RepID=A0ABU0BZ44_9HYPH|nr:hypothetical protein [Pararhizobium capsulatum]MDQ0323538.1 small-conductance mechanosensitive channel [Pararhizobium capsulatum DSM 1112]
MLIAVAAYFVMALIFVAFLYMDRQALPRPGWTPSRVLAMLLAVVWPGILLVLLTTHFVMKANKVQDNATIPEWAKGVQGD